MADATWRDRLAVGDEVIVVSDFGHTRRLARVTHATKTQVVADNGSYVSRFQRSTGNKIGSGAWSRVHLAEATPEDAATVKAEQRRADLLSAIRHTEWKDLPTATLEAVAAALATPAPGAGGHDG